MQERWAVAFEPCDMGKGKYLWLRSRSGDILIFGSKQEAKGWVLSRVSFSREPDDALYVKLPQGSS